MAPTRGNYLEQIVVALYCCAHFFLMFAMLGIFFMVGAVQLV